MSDRSHARLPWILVPAALLLALVAWRAWPHVGPRLVGLLRGASAAVQRQAEDWIGDRLLAAANDALRPELRCAGFRWEAPKTIILLRPALYDGDLAILEAESLRVTLGSLPAKDRPLVLEGVELAAPVVRLVRDDAGALRGFSDLLESAPAGTGAADATKSSTTFGETLAIRRIAIADGRLIIAAPGEPAMELDHLTFGLDCDPSAAPGQYALDLDLARDRDLILAGTGMIDLDALLVELDGITLGIELDEPAWKRFPPAIQKFMTEHRLRGDLDATFTGRIALTSAGTSAWSIDATLRDGFASFDDWQWPVAELDTRLDFDDDGMTIGTTSVRCFDGTLHGKGRLEFAEHAPADLEVAVDGVRLEKLIVPDGDSSRPPRYAGRIVGFGAFKGLLGDPEQEAAGSIDISIDQGRLIELPAVGALVKAVRGMIPLLGPANDTATYTGTFTTDGFRLDHGEIVSGAVLIRGSGLHRYDGGLDMLMNAGPLERIQGELGVVGEVFGAVTDRLVKYHLTGTLSDPKVTLRPLGL